MRGLTDSVVDIGDRRLRTRTWGDPPASIVMLHHGLGSISQFRDLPGRLHRATGDAILAYDRAGHGNSLPTPSDEWPADWLHIEAGVLAAVLIAEGITRPLLVGHSDGASIALIHAAGVGGSVAGLVALAPHSFVEDKAVAAIAALRSEPAQLLATLAEHHTEPVALFEAWSGAWLSEAFRDWDIRGRLGGIPAPALVLQGSRDAFASDEMVWSTVSAVGSRAEGRLLDGLGHDLPREGPTLLCDLITAFNLLVATPGFDMPQDG